MNRTLAWLIAASTASTLVACGMSSSETSSLAGSDRNAGEATSSSGGSGGLNGGSAAPGTSSSSGGSTGTGETATDGENPGTQQQAGQLTAGVWDDNLNFDFFSKYAAGAELALKGLPTFTATERGKNALTSLPRSRWICFW